jgi:hypothetical protein
MKKKIALLTAVSIVTACAVRVAIVWRRLKSEEEQNKLAFE